MTFITAHWAMILSIFAIIHVTVSSILGLLNKPKAETVFEQVWHYVQIAAGLGKKFAAFMDASVATAVSALTGEAASLANGKHFCGSNCSWLPSL